MPLPLPNLDDRTFDQLVEEARKIIPRFAPGWTDHNLHDPGITFVELFAWLTEMQHYYVNQVREENYLKFLKLLNIKPRTRQPAVTDVSFSLKDLQKDQLTVPAGAKLRSEGSVFQIENTLQVYPVQLEKIISALRSGLIDFSESNAEVGLSYAAFGETVEPGNRLYLGFVKESAVPLNRLPAGVVFPASMKSRIFYDENAGLLIFRGMMTKQEKNLLLSLPIGEIFAYIGAVEALFQWSQTLFPPGVPIAVTIDLTTGNRSEDKGSATAPGVLFPSGVVKWEYYRQANGGIWQPLDLVAELDQIFSEVLASAPGSQPLCRSKHRLLLNRVRQGRVYGTLSAENRSRLDNLFLKTYTPTAIKKILANPLVPEVQSDQTIMFTRSGRFFFTAPDDFGEFVLNPFPGKRAWIRATVLESTYEIAPQVDTMFINTVPARQIDSYSEVQSFSSSGAAGQTFEVQSYLAFSGKNIVQVQERNGTWVDWEVRENFHSSNPADNHVVLLKVEEDALLVVEFGDGRGGRIPPAGVENIRLISYSAEFETRRFPGHSDGLPNQSFALNPLPVLPEGFRLQVAEEVPEPAETVQTSEIGCLVKIDRFTPTFVLAGEPFPVKIVVTARQPICRLELFEQLLTKADPAPLPPEPMVVENISAGERVELPPVFYQVDHHGGSIMGEFVISHGDFCPKTTGTIPVSIVRVKDHKEQKILPGVLEWQRSCPVKVGEGERFPVKVQVTALQPLQSLSLRERLQDDLKFHGKEEGEFSYGEMQTGEQVEFCYLVQADRQAGTIGGELTVTPEGGTPMMETMPDSPVEVGGMDRKYCWRDWKAVGDFDASGPADPHFRIDTENGRILFGDGINGDIPANLGNEYLKELRLIGYRVGGGEAGNVLPGAIDRVQSGFSGYDLLSVENHRSAAEGSEPETSAEAQTRARKDLKIRNRALTSADFETLALRTPGVQVARAKAIPLFSPNLVGYPHKRSEANVTVVVVPLSESIRPMPSPGFLETVCRYLEQRRLVTTRVHVIAPQYVRLSVRARALLEKGFQDTATSQRIVLALQAFLHPLSGGPNGSGWPFGRTVYRSEIYQVIESVEGVDCAQNVVMSAEGEDISRDRQGNILIPPQSLVYYGDIQIEILPAAPLCRV